MKLYIDTSDSEKISIKIDGKEFVSSSKKQKAQALLPLIDQKLKQKNMNIKDITEIEFNEGPGSFTGLRVGATIANTLGWALKIPVNGKRIYNGSSLKYD